MRRILIVAAALFSVSDLSLAAQAGPSSPVWRRSMGARAIAAPYALAGSIVVACDDGSLRSYAGSGADLWRWDSGGRLLPALSRSPEGTNYAIRTDGRLVSINRAGRELWRRDLKETTSKAFLSLGWDGRLFVGTDSSLLCFTSAGFPLWRRPLRSPPARPPTLDAAGNVVLLLADGTLLRATPFGELSTISLPRRPTAFAALFGADTDDSSGGEVAVAFEDGRLIVYAPTGESRPLALLRREAIALAGKGDLLAYALQGGEVGLINIPDGKVLWTAALPKTDGGDFFIDDRGIYFLSRRGSAGFSFDGRRLWTITIDGASAPPHLGDDGLLYSGGQDWILYAYRVEQRVRADIDPIYGPGPQGSYGIGERGATYQFATDGDEAAIASRLSEIRKRLDFGEVGSDEIAFTADLMDIAGGALGSISTTRRSFPASPPHLREYAAVLLSRFASKETIPFLIDLFVREQEPFVRAAAAEAIGAVGVDPSGAALRAFAAAVFPPEPLRDERALVAVAAATGALCRISGPPLSEDGVSILVSLAQDERPPSVRERARTELKSLALR